MNFMFVSNSGRRACGAVGLQGRLLGPLRREEGGVVGGGEGGGGGGGEGEGSEVTAGSETAWPAELVCCILTQPGPGGGRAG